MKGAKSLDVSDATRRKGGGAKTGSRPATRGATGDHRGAGSAISSQQISVVAQGGGERRGKGGGIRLGQRPAIKAFGFSMGKGKN